jgi:hypothetical protein
MIDVVCVRHGNIYDWSWVDKLYNGVKRSITDDFTFHVFTDVIDHSRSHYNQILLPEMGNRGYEKNAGAWWYKVWLFSEEHPIQRPMIYFDLDTIFVDNCDFLLECPDDMFGGFLNWSLKENTTGNKKGFLKKYMLNSSIMKFDPRLYRYIWETYKKDRNHFQRKYHGDQDYISDYIDKESVYLYDNETKIISYAYQMLHGGIKNITTVAKVSAHKSVIKKRYNNPEIDYVLPSSTAIVICNGHKYKPDSLMHLKFIKDFWI